MALLIAGAAALPSTAQNWSIVIQDNALGTPVNQINGTAGGTATLSATLLNFTGTPISDDGLGNPAPATTFIFAGFGWTQNPGQSDLESLFTPDPAIPGFPEVPGSPDGTQAGTSGYVALGTFDLSGLAPGFYEQDFSATAFPLDPDSTVPFSDVTGTLRLNVMAAATVAPEPCTLVLLSTCFLPIGIAWKCRLCEFT